MKPIYKWPFFSYFLKRPRFVQYSAALPSGEIFKKQISNQWFKDGEELIRKNLRRKVISNKAKGVIVFIGDGMGISTVTAGRILDGQLKNQTGEENILSWEDNDNFPNVALSKTYNTDMQTSDSAGTATAIMTGVKTKSGVISLNENAKRSDCASSKGQDVLSVIMLAEMAGLSTGVVTTARITHATPATAYAHSAERSWEADVDVPVGSSCKDIASQLIDFPYGDGLEVAFGGGRRNFLPNSEKDIGEKGLFGKRSDGRNLVHEWLNKSKHHYYVNNEKGFKNLHPEKVDHVLGLFNYDHMQYSYDRRNDIAGEPSLTDMVEFAVKVLSKNDKGYVLLVEAGRVDHGHHASKPFQALHDTVEMGRAVKKATSMTNPEETLTIVTADHSHVFTFGGYQSRGTDIFNYTNAKRFIAKDGQRFTSLSYANGPGGGLRPPTNEQLKDKDFKWPSLVPLNSETHGAEDVGIYARGTQSHLIRGVVEQNYIFHVVDYALCLSQNKQKLCAEEKTTTKSSSSKKSLIPILQAVMPALYVLVILL
ncbi:alkaline phosphatase-like isoform X1 [Hydractinia symbiolongicarpus]|uniref:alkaline phosphatase-like isoform X1 n=1 Tax=Hydractinia symbiolongicarpus TaxID=13093 RepID=UPI00254E8591|nr:alkaline phosphatase-like isoform X1 [Hydractinia symbiolongicarpus]